MLGCFCLGWLLFWCWCRVFPRRLLCILVGCCVWFLLWLGRRVLASCWESFFCSWGVISSSIVERSMELVCSCRVRSFVFVGISPWGVILPMYSLVIFCGYFLFCL